MAQVDSVSFDAALKEFYTDEYVREQVYEDNPFYAMVPKLTSLTGDTYVQPVQHGIAIGGRSATFATALANKDTNKYKKFNVTTVDDYAMISIGRKVMKQSANNRGAFFEARTREIDGMLKALTRSLAVKLFRNSGGAMGRVGSLSTVTLTLKEPEDVCNFEVGQSLAASLNDGSAAAHTLRASGAVNTITAIDRDAGTLTAATAWATAISGLIADDYLFAEGDFKNAVSGLAAWIPTTAPTSGDSHFGVDRSTDVSRLAGSRVSAAGDPIAEALRKGAARLGREGASPDCVFMSHQKYRDLILELGNKVEYEQGKAADANVGFTGVKIIGAKKPITCFPDHNCPDAQAYMLTKYTWKLVSLGPVPDLHDDDGVRMLRESTSDGFEVRASYYANLVCCDPRANAVITLE